MLFHCVTLRLLGLEHDSLFVIAVKLKATKHDLQTLGVVCVTLSVSAVLGNCES